MGPRAFNRVCASIRINRDYVVVSVRINAHGVTKRAWAFNCETTVYTREGVFYIGGRGFVCQIIEPVTFARCAFIFALCNIALGGYLDTRRNI